jgi:hypothetical protein
MIAMPFAIRSMQKLTEIDPDNFEAIVQRPQVSHSQDVTGQVSALTGQVSAISSEASARSAEGIEFELVKTGYPMQNVRCHCSESSIRLTGHVRRYFYLQIAIEIARRLAGGRRIDNEIEVDVCSGECPEDTDADF